MTRGASWKDHLPFYAPAVAFFCYAAHQVSGMALWEWDESHYVLNAYEMMRGGDWIALHYAGALDHVSTKPPLAVWLMAVLFKLFGYSELIARLPSLILGLGTGALVYHFVARIGKDRAAAAAAGLGLVTSWGFYGAHGMTSADLDVPVAFFNTLSFIAIYFACIESKPRWSLALGLSLGLGFMTKSFMGLFPVVFVAPALLLNGDRKKLFNRDLLTGAGLFILTVAPWLAARQLGYDDNFLKLMFGLDFLQRTQGVVDVHRQPAGFYFQAIPVQLGWWWTAAGIAAAAAGLRAWFVRGDRSVLKAFALALFSFAIFVAIFSAAQTKTKWYMFPAYPLFFIAAGLGVSSFMDFVPRALRYGVLAALLASNLPGLYVYDRGWRATTHTAELDYIIYPMKDWLWRRKAIIAGKMHNNSFDSVRIYTDLQETLVAEGAPLETMLAASPQADFLIAMDSRRFMKGDVSNTPRLKAIRVVTEGESFPGIFQIIRN